MGGVDDRDDVDVDVMLVVFGCCLVVDEGADVIVTLLGLRWIGEHFQRCVCVCVYAC